MTNTSPLGVAIVPTALRDTSSLTGIYKMYIPTADRLKIHQYLFKEGVLVAKKDFNQPSHEATGVKNLYVIKALQSLNSRGFVKTQFSWQYYYYTLTEEGVEYLRQWLNLPENIVPSTYKNPRAD